MGRMHLDLIVRLTFAIIVLVSISIFSGCGEQTSTTQGDTSGSTTGTGKEVDGLPARGIQTVTTPPAKAVFGMIYIDATTNREYIYDGSQWVPHDTSVDDYYKTTSSKTSANKSVVLPAAGACTLPDCNPDGAHLKHVGTNYANIGCTSCHVPVMVNSNFDHFSWFAQDGPAVIKPSPTNPNPPLPSFDATTNTCSNIACHSVSAGTFSYYFPGGDGEPVLNAINYGSNATGNITPSWYTLIVGDACATCHPNPPANGSNGSNVWHSGFHAGGSTAASNQCQFCHPDAYGSNGKGTSITNPLMHGDGVVQVQARFSSRCFGCH